MSDGPHGKRRVLHTTVPSIARWRLSRQPCSSSLLSLPTRYSHAEHCSGLHLVRLSQQRLESKVTEESDTFAVLS